ncbi:CDR1 [Candida metapsilosis]|uniref:CDR1 n=1 Tax=Candida metapsilosis TaxID=273372 RepID=A0A8H7ZCS6_9ASCO|nr:CDR1 [Candida metapsilosis]
MQKEIPSNRETFFWKDLTYQVKIKSEDRVILDHIDGWGQTWTDYGIDGSICAAEANPAESVSQVVGAAPGSHAKHNCFEVWRNSQEYQNGKRFSSWRSSFRNCPEMKTQEDNYTYAAPLWKQYLIVTWKPIMSTLCLSFCDVLKTGDQLPGFWIYIYRCKPIYFIYGYKVGKQFS